MKVSKFSAILGSIVVVLVLAACGYAAANDQLDGVDKAANGYNVFLPKNHVERNNYEKSQRLYDDPTTIIWCSTTWGNSSAPIVTVPIAGKLTSSSSSFFPTSRTEIDGGDGKTEYTPERRSVDGMYHGSPPPYRYGFTPGGQYVDFFNMPTFCTTALTKFQRENTQVTVSVSAKDQQADTAAQEALKRGDKAGAQRALEATESVK